MSSLLNLIRLSKARLEANHRLLMLFDVGSAEHNENVDRQRHVFATALRAMPDMPEDIAVKLCEDVAAVGWPSHREEIAAIMDKVKQWPPAEPRLLQRPCPLRTLQQNYVDIDQHVPERIWAADGELFLQLLCEFICVDMGLQNASEATVQKLVALSLLMAHGGRNGATSTSWPHKRSLTDLVKKYLRQHRYQRPVEWITNLPVDQVSFRAQFPGQWNQSQARGDNQAVPCPHHRADVQAVVQTVPMRNSLKRTAEHNLASGAPLDNSIVATSGSPTHELMRMFAQLLGGRNLRGPGDGDGGIALEFPPQRQQLQVVMNWLMG